MKAPQESYGVTRRGRIVSDDVISQIEKQYEMAKERGVAFQETLQKGSYRYHCAYCDSLLCRCTGVVSPHACLQAQR